MNEKIFSKAQKAVRLLKENDLKVSTAESCTGGLLSAYITAVSGASSVFQMGICSYSNRIKNEKLGVRAQTLENFGAVSESTAREMAEGIRKSAEADIGLSVTGVAGPEPSEGKEVGLVFIAAATKKGTVAKKLKIKPVSREFIRESATDELFNLLIDTIGDMQ